MGTSSLPFEQKKKLYYGVSAQTLEQVTAASCGVFILGGIQNSDGQCPEQPAVVDIALSNPKPLFWIRPSQKVLSNPDDSVILSYDKKLNGFLEAIEQIRGH